MKRLSLTDSYLFFLLLLLLLCIRLKCYSLLVRKKCIRSFMWAQNKHAEFLQHSSSNPRESPSILQYLNETGTTEAFTAQFHVQTRKELLQLWNALNQPQKFSLTSKNVHQLMTTALNFDDPQFAITIFERFHDFPYSTHYLQGSDTGQNFKKLSSGGNYELVEKVNLSKPIGTEVLLPHPHLVTTAIKAYGRTRNYVLSHALINWAEKDHKISPDIYMMSALLYVMAKTRQVKMAEQIFWNDIPQRGLEYNAVTINSLMYMYSRLKRPQDALSMYEMMKKRGIQCTMVTYGILVKGLMLSGDSALHEVAKNIVSSLPSMNLKPTVEIYNQMLEFYAAVKNADGALDVYQMMQTSIPPVQLNSLSYGHLIYCLASSRKHDAALTLFRQLKELILIQNYSPTKSLPTRSMGPIPPSSETLFVNEYVYMGVLKSLAALRDGIGAVQILTEMMDQQVRVDQKHVATVLFACVVSNQLDLAEAVINAFVQHASEVPDIVLCNLWLRVYWQQENWQKGYEILHKMETNTDSYPSPSLITYRELLKHQILSEKWEDAEKTFATLLATYSQQLAALDIQDGTMIDGFESLSYALGRYSTSMKYDYEQDKYFGRGCLVSPNYQEMLRRQNFKINESVFSLQSTNSNQSSTDRSDGSSDVCTLSNEDSAISVLLPTLETINQVDTELEDNENSFRGSIFHDRESNKNLTNSLRTIITRSIHNDIKNGKNSSSIILDSLSQFSFSPIPSSLSSSAGIDNKISFQPLPEPSNAAMKFMLKMLFICSKFRNVSVPSITYCELIRALLLMKEFSACKLLMNWRMNADIVVKTPTDNMEKILRVERTALDVISQYLV